ncbi:hypothetical protein GCM10009605_63440 [Nocardiopsis composta]
MSESGGGAARPGPRPSSRRPLPPDAGAFQAAPDPRLITCDPDSIILGFSGWGSFERQMTEGPMFGPLILEGVPPSSAGGVQCSPDRAMAPTPEPNRSPAREGRRGGLLPWTLLILGGRASPAANVAVADPTAWPRTVHAWPSSALTGAYELLSAPVRPRDGRYGVRLRPPFADGAGGAFLVLLPAGTAYRHAVSTSHY